MSPPYAPAFIQTPPPGRAGDGARELEAAEARCAGAVQADGERRAAARDEHVALDRGGGEVAGELQHERVDALVGDEQVRAEPDDRYLAPRARPPRRAPPRAPRPWPAARTSAPGRRCRAW